MESMGTNMGLETTDIQVNPGTGKCDQDPKIQEPIYQIKTKQSINGKIIDLQGRISTK